MRKFSCTIALLFLFTVLFVPITTNASDQSIKSAFREIMINGETYYVETVIMENNHDSAKGPAQTKTATKTDYYRDANNNIMCSLSITGTFIYDGISSQCVSCSHQAVSYDSHWTFKTSASSYSGNSATATATITLSDLISHDFYTSVTIYCSPTGVIS